MENRLPLGYTRDKRCKLRCSVKDRVVVANHADFAPGGTLMVAQAVQGIDLRRSLGKLVAASRFVKKNDFP